MATDSTEPRITLDPHDRRVQVKIGDTLLADPALRQAILELAHLVPRQAGTRIENPWILKGFSLAMAALLVWVASTIGYEHVWLPLASGVG